MVPMTRSQIAFAVGLRGGLFNTRSPSRLTDSMARLFAAIASPGWAVVPELLRDAEIDRVVRECCVACTADARGL